MIMVMPMIPFAKVAHLMLISKCPKQHPDSLAYSIALGSLIDASFNSSDMCAPASGPIKHQIGDDKPMRQESPVLGHPPPLLDDVSDLLANGSDLDTY